MNRKRLFICSAGLIIGLLVIMPIGWKKGGFHPADRKVVAAAPVISKATAPGKSLIDPVSARRIKFSVPPPAAGAVHVPSPLDNAPVAVKAFNAWAKRYFLAEPWERAKLVPEGLKLAEQQRAAIGELIPHDPKKALESAVPMVVRQDLPPEITAQLEQRVNARGKLSVMASVSPQSGSSDEAPPPIYREFEASGKAPMRAFVYGRRAGPLSVNETRVNGVVVDGQIAVAESVVRPLEVGERPDPAKRVSQVCPVSGNQSEVAVSKDAPPPPIDVNTPAVEDDQETQYVCCDTHISQLVSTLSQAEWTAHWESLGVTLAEGGTGGAVSPIGVPIGWTTGSRTLLYIRTAFPDKMEDPQSEADCYANLKLATDYFMKCSYGRLYITPTVTPLIVLPYPEGWYASISNGDTVLYAQAQEIARQQGYDTSNYNLDVVRWDSSTVGSYGGLAIVGGKMVLLKNNFIGTLCHELGHNLGLWHSNRWQTNPVSTIGTGNNDEYGNKFSVLGSSSADGQYPAADKALGLGWLAPQNYYNVTASGTYRLYQVDQSVSDAGKRYAMTINKDSERNYWFEFRQSIANPTFMNGLMVTWDSWGLRGIGGSGGNPYEGSNGGTQLLDMTPGKAPPTALVQQAAPASPDLPNDTRDDAGLTIGRTFTDPETHMHVTPIAKGTTTPPYVDVVVNLGDPPGNQAPLLTISAPSNIVFAGTSLTLTANSTDPDGDTVAYFWDFGDNTTSVDNQRVQNKIWTTFGLFTVTCTASDMKGMQTTRSMLVTVGSANGYTVSGTVRDTNGDPVEGVYVTDQALTIYAVYNTAAPYSVPAPFPSSYCYTDSNGNYTLTNLASGGVYHITATRYPYVFGVANFTNPLTVTGNSTGNDFNGSSVPTLSVQVITPTASQVTPTTQKGLIRLTRGTDMKGTLPALKVQVLNASSGTAILGSDYTITPALTADTNLKGSGTSYVTIPTNVLSLDLTITAVANPGHPGTKYAILNIPNTVCTIDPTTDAVVTYYVVTGTNTPTVAISDASSLPVISLTADSSVMTEGGSNATLRVTSDIPVPSNLTVNLTYGGTATIGTEYTAPASVMIPANQTSATFDLAAIDDLVSQGSETVTVNLAASASYWPDITKSGTTVSRVDNDLPTVTVAATVPNTTRGGATPGKFTFTRAGVDPGLDLTVEFSVGGSALHGVDYRRIDGYAVIPANEFTVDVPVQAFVNTNSEGPLTVTCEVNVSNSYSVGMPNVATVTIADSGLPAFTIRSAMAAPKKPFGGSPSQQTLFYVSRPAPSPNTGAIMAVKYSATSGPGLAVPGVDYQALFGTLYFFATDVTLPIDVTLLPGTAHQDARPLTVTLLPDTGTSYKLGFESSATTVIIDGGQPAVDVSAIDSSNTNTLVLDNSGANSMGFCFARSGATTGALTVNYTLGGTAVLNTDYTLPSLPLSSCSITSGSRNVTCASTTNLLPGMIIVGTGIPSNATVSSITSATQFVISVAATATKSGQSFNAFFISLSGTANIPIGLSFKDLYLTPIVQTVPSGVKTITATVTSAGGYGIRTGTATIVLGNHVNYPGSPAPSVGFASPNSTWDETAGTIAVPVHVTGTPAGQVTVQYRVEGGTATGHGVDYTFTPGQLGFTPPYPVSDQNLFLTINPSAFPQGSKTVILQLENVTGANLDAIQTLTGGSTTSTSTNVTCASTVGLQVGMTVTGTGIPAGATVTSITNSTVFVISSAATATNSGQTYTASLATHTHTITINPIAFPETFTDAVTGLPLTGTMLHGHVLTNGLASQTTDSWFEWGPTTAYGTKTTVTSNANSTSPVTLQAAITGLTYPKTYHYRAASSNAKGTTYGIDRTISTVAPATAVTLSDAGHSPTSATLAGLVNNGRLASYYWFEWGTSSVLPYANQTPTVQLASGLNSSTVTAAITGLVDGTIYHYRVAIQTAAGPIVYGSDMTLAAISQQVAGEVVVNLRAKHPSAGTATWTNQGTLGGAFTRAGTASPAASVLGSGIPGVFFNGVTDSYTGPSLPTQLQGNNKRTIEAWVFNPGFGDTDEIVSLGRAGTRTETTLVNNLNASNAVIHGADDMAYTAATVPAPGQWHHYVYTYDGALHAKLYVDGMLKVSKTLGGPLNLGADPIDLALSNGVTGVPGTPSFHGYINSVLIGTGMLTAAQVLTNFNLGATGTTAAAPVATTLGASNLTSTTATLNARVIPQGAATTAWIEWGTSTSYDNATTPQSVGSAWAPFSVTAPLIGLAEGVQYHFRVVAQNSFGTTAGSDVVFTPGTIANSGILWVDLRATDATAGMATWKNLGALGDFTGVGTLTAVASAAGTGIAGVQFDGTTSAYQSLNNADLDFSFQSDRSIEAWVLNPALDQPSETVVNLGRQIGTRTSLQLSAGSADAWVAGTDTGLWSSATPPSPPSAGIWHHVVLVHNGAANTLSTYVDGVLALSFTAPAGWNTWADPVLLGAARDSTGAAIWGTNGFSGFLNSLRIHGGALTAAQVAANYTAGPATVSGAPGTAPLATTLAADLISGASATLHGEVTPGGLATQGWMEWGTSAGTLNTTTAAVNLPNTFTAEDVNVPIGGLTSGQTYYYRVVAQNAQGTVPGSVLSFVSTGNLPNLPGATTNAATGVAAGGKATLNGTAVPDGLATKAWFEYGPTVNLGSTTATTSLTAATVSKTMTAALTGLLPHTTYYFRLVAQNTAGTVVGSVLTFATANSMLTATPGSVTIKENSATVLSLKATDSDKQTLNYVVIGAGPQHGSLSGMGLTPTYTPVTYYHGTDSFQFAVTDGVQQSNTVTFSITVTPVNQPPYGVNAPASGPEDTSIVGAVTAIDPEGDPILSYAKASDPTHGTVIVTATTGAFTYVPAPNYNGPDSFTFTASNGAGTGPAGTISITVTPVPDAPTASNSSAWTPKNLSVSGNVIGADVDGNPISYAKLVDPSHGTVTAFNTTTGAWTYSPSANYVGTDFFTFNVSDGTLTSNSATVTITISGPTANDATFTGVRDDLISGMLNASDPNSASLTYSLVTAPQHGSATVNSAGTFSYNPVADFIGTDTFTFKVNNGTLDSNPGTITLIITERPPEWTWQQGSNVAKKPGTYGTFRLTAAANIPGARTGAASWTDASGNFWVFGGTGFATSATAGLLNDLWKRDATTGQWTWIKGGNTTNGAGVYGAPGQNNPTNTPGARTGAQTWFSGGKLWLFGGTGRDSSATGNGMLNDLWYFHLGTGNWIWVKGSNFVNANGTYGSLGIASSTNTPGGRNGESGWVDAAGNLLLFGGNGRPGTGTLTGNLNDLWKYDPVANKWAWINGSSGLDANGVYGTMGTATTMTTPGGRSFASVWCGANANSPGSAGFYLFGGAGRAATGTTKGSLNDLWLYDQNNNTWTWLGGSNALNAAGVYGTLALAAPTNQPGARSASSAWVDATGNLWLFGGQGSSGLLNDLWRFDPSASAWVWMKGPSTANGAGAYGTLGVSAHGNTPGARSGACSFVDVNGDLWLFGGASGVSSYNDVWSLGLPRVPAITQFGISGIGNTGATLQLQASTFGQTMTAAFLVWNPVTPNSVSTFYPAVIAGGSTATASYGLTGLTAGTSYMVQATATNILGTGRSEPVEFTTTGSAPATNVSFASSSATVGEASGVANVTVNLNVPAPAAFTIPLTLGGSATAGIKYTAPPPYVTFTAGQSLALISIPIINELTVEGDQTVTLTLGTPTGGVNVLPPSVFTLTITDDDVVPSIDFPPASQFVTVGTPTTFTVVATGSNLTYQWKKNGVNIPGATSSSYTIASAALSSAANYSCDVKNSLAVATTISAELYVVDATPKSVILTAGPTQNTSFTAAAAGPPGSTIIYAWQENGFPVVLSPPHLQVASATPQTLAFVGILTGDTGNYTCKVSKAGVPSLNAVSGNIRLAVPNQIPVLQAINPGPGLPSGVVGSPYSYQVLSNADAPVSNLGTTPSSFSANGLPAGLTINPTTGLISGKPAAAVTAQVVTITAKNVIGTSAPLTPIINILPLPAGVAGTFVGLIDSASATSNLGGRFDLSVGATGSFTAKVTLAGSTASTSGQVVPTITSGVVSAVGGTATFARPGNQPLTVIFTINFAANTLTGTFTDPLLGSAPVNGLRNIWSTGAPATTAGNYTFAMQIPAASVGDINIPQGAGFGTFTVAAAGTLTVIGKTADGQSFTVNTIVGPAGQLPMFAPFTTSLGSLIGTPVITAGSLNGNTLSWSKNVAPATSKDMGYRQGFDPIDLDVTGGIYVQPALVGILFGLPNTSNNAKLTFAEGGLVTADAPPVIFTISDTSATTTAQTITLPTAGGVLNPDKVTLTLSLTPGTYTGSFTIPNPVVALARKVTFYGVLTNNVPAPGFFLVPQLPEPGQTLTTSPVLSAAINLTTP